MANAPGYTDILRPEWFAAFLADRGTRKPSAHTIKAYRQDFDAIAALGRRHPGPGTLASPYRIAPNLQSVQSSWSSPRPSTFAARSDSPRSGCWSTTPSRTPPPGPSVLAKSQPPRIIPIVGLVGCVILAVALPPASVITGAAVIALGAVVYGLRRAVLK